MQTSTHHSCRALTSRLLRALILAPALLLPGLPAAAPLQGGINSDDQPWTQEMLIQPADLAAKLTNGKGTKPVLLHVGFRLLYRSARIANSQYVGPTAKPEGLDDLRQALLKVPKDREVVIYCGCCPWKECPNMRPATRLLREMGFKKARVLMIPTNLPTDWVNKGYPTDKGE